MSEAMATLESIPATDSMRSWPRFALRGVAGGLTVGGMMAWGEFLYRGRDFREVALPTLLVLYPLVGLGLGLLYHRYRRGGLRKGFFSVEFFSVEPLPPNEAAERDRRVRRFLGAGFGVGVAVALLATALDFAWRGWPYLAGTSVGGLILYPYSGLLLGYYFGLRQGDPRPSIRDLRFRTRTLMLTVAYVALLFGLATEATRYSGPALRYHSDALNARSMVDIYQRQLDKNRADLERAGHAKELRAGRVPEGILPSQAAFLKGLEGKTTEQDRRDRYGLVADGEDRQALLASQNVRLFARLVDYHKRLAEKYARAAAMPWAPVEPDPPVPQ